MSYMIFIYETKKMYKLKLDDEEADSRKEARQIGIDTVKKGNLKSMKSDNKLIAISSKIKDKKIK